jgi:hypothetical protein
MTLYILSEWDGADNRLLGHFGPFASQVEAMNYAESERRADPRSTGRGIRWFVDPLTAPEGVTQGLGELRLRLLGWHRSAVSPPDSIDLAAQLFFKTIKSDGTVEL